LLATIVASFAAQRHPVISPRALIGAATQLATAPLRCAARVAREAQDAATYAQDAIMAIGEQALFALLDAVVVRMMEDDAIDWVLQRAEVAGVAQQVVDRVLADGIIEQIADRVLSGPELERMVASAFRSTLPEEVIEQLLKSEAVWILVEEIARSPSVTEAIAHQGTGFLENVAAKARDRSRHADTRVQRLAQRLSRHPREDVETPRDGTSPSPKFPRSEAR
jgi:hypothetical protein